MSCDRCVTSLAFGAIKANKGRRSITLAMLIYPGDHRDVLRGGHCPLLSNDQPDVWVNESGTSHRGTRNGSFSMWGKVCHVQRLILLGVTALCVVLQYKGSSDIGKY